MNKINININFKEIVTRKETISVALILVFVGAILFSMFVSPQLSQWSIHEGDIALKNTYAPYDFTYFWEVDDNATRAAKEAAGRSVPFLLKRNYSGEEKTISEVEGILNVIQEESVKDVPLSEKTSFVKEKSGKNISDRTLRTLFEYPDIQDLRKKTLNILEHVYQKGYISEENLAYLTGKSASNVAFYDDLSGVGEEIELKDILDKYDISEAIEKYASKLFESDRKTRNAVQAFLVSYISPNLDPEEKETGKLREKTVGEVGSVYKSWDVKKNELIVEKGKRVNARHIAQISQIRRVFRPGTTPTFFMGVLLLFVLLGLIAFIYTVFTQKKDYLKYTKSLAIILINMFFMVILSDFIMRSPQPSYFIPLAGMAMIITLLVGFNGAFLSVVLMSILIAFLISGKVEVMLVLIVGSLAGMLAVKDARRRANVLWAGVLAGLAKFLAITCIGLINGMETDFYVRDGMWAVASGLFSGLMVMGLLPVFEYLFKVPTNISLLEMSDLNHPLLKKMALEAPGTYHHCILVGNLAESACDAIGANSLLARVGAYYHDIGKMPKAEYFTENEMGAGSKHANLAPSMSALIISKHVKEGVEMARQHKLNNTIVDFIKQHHGNSLIAFFYQKALEKVEDGTDLKEENFRYPGPRPQTKESAIVLLADSVEASSRSLDDPTPSSIRNLVRKIINNKFIDGQLDECDLTLKDMHMIADSFVRVLMGIFHTRPDYPEDSKKTSNGNGTDDNGKSRKPKQKKKN